MLQVKDNICSSNSDSFTIDIESIHLACWKKMILMIIFLSMKNMEALAYLLVYNVVARKLTYEENDFKGDIVNIYQNPQALINYLIDTSSNEGD
jgi:hypothetical protein